MTAFVIALLVAVIGLQTAAIVVGDRHNRVGLRVIETANAMFRDSAESQLRQIHTLVNSDMTSARMGELGQALLSLSLMKRLMALEEAAGNDTSKEAALIARTEERVEELRATLADRRVQQAKLEEQLIAEMKR